MRTFLFRLLLLLGASGVALSQASPVRARSSEVRVELSMQSHVRGVDVTVGDIATVTGLDPEAVRRVSALSLGSAPSPGYSRVFRRDRVGAAIQRAQGGVGIRMLGEPACRVFPEVEEISAERLERLARERLDTDLAFTDSEYELVGELRPIAVPAGSQGLRVRVRPGDLPSTSGTLSVPLEVFVDEARYRTVWTSWRVKRYETREVLAKGVIAGETLAPGHFERRRVQVSAGDSEPMGAQMLEGAVALHDLLPGEAIFAGDVHRPMVVTLGERIFLEVRRGAIQARVSAIALGSGSIGDRIRVRTADSGQELMATVRTRDLCRIDLGTR